MRALAKRAGDGGEVEFVDAPDPEPLSNEAVVEVKAVAVNRGELRLLSFRDAGWRPGQDVAGIVSRAAADGSGPPTGARVVAWPEQAGWAERVAVPTTHLAVLDPDVSFPAASTLPIAGMTALRALRRGGNLEGRRVLVTGASGGVGRFAVQLAANQGAEVVGVASQPERATGLTDLGCAEVVHEIETAEGPFDLILESVGGTSLEAAIGLVAPGGTVVMFGNSSDQRSTLAFGDFRGRAGAKLEAFFVYESGEPPLFGDDLQLLADMLSAGSLRPQIGLEVGWDEANLAFRELGERKVNGKAVLLVG